MPRRFNLFAALGYVSEFQAVIYIVTIPPDQALRSDLVEYLQELRLELPEGFDLDALRAAAVRIGSAKVVRAVRRLEELWRQEA